MTLFQLTPFQIPVIKRRTTVKALRSLLKQPKAWLQLLGTVCGIRVKKEVDLTLFVLN